MFDVGLLELLLVGIVALLVVGPERLPKLARTAGMWLSEQRSVRRPVPTGGTDRPMVRPTHREEAT